MDGGWVKLSGQPYYAINMNCVQSVQFGEYSPDKGVMVEFANANGSALSQEVILSDQDAAVIKQWLDAHAYDGAEEYSVAVPTPRRPKR